MGSIALQATIAIWPNELHKLAWAVPWVWGLWAAIWVVWLASHPNFWRPIFAGKTPEPSIRERAQEVVNRLQKSSTQNAIPSITNAPTFSNAPVFAPQINVSPIPPPTPSVPAPVVTRDEPEPNIVFIGARMIPVRINMSGGDSFHELDGKEAKNADMFGAIACFRNEAVYGKHIPPIKGARAHTKLFDKNGQEIGTGFSAALWLGHKGDTYDLIPGGSSGCVLIFIGNGEEFVVPWKSRSYESSPVRDHTKDLLEIPTSAEVSVLDRSHRPVFPPLRLEFSQKENGEMEVKAMPQM